MTSLDVRSTIGDRDVGGGIGGSDVFRTGTDEAIVVVLLDDVSGPAGDAADGKDGGEEIDVYAEGGVSGG